MPITFLSNASANFGENGDGVVRNVQAAEDSGQADTDITYTISGGADAALFTIDAATGSLRFREAPDFENPGDVNRDNIYLVEVTATTRGGESSVQLVSVAVANEAAERAYSEMVPFFDLFYLNGQNGFALGGIDTGDGSGASVSIIGDINGDGIDDLVIGAPNAESTSAFSSGESYVVFGTDQGFPAAMTLSQLDGTNGFVLNGINRGDVSGLSVSGAGDVNGDGFDDLIIGAHLADPNGVIDAGESYVIFGTDEGFGSSLDLASLDGNNGFTIQGINEGDKSGYAVDGAGDVNGDGFDDLIVSAIGADPNGSLSGETYVVFGTDQGFGSNFDLADLDGTNGFVIRGIDTHDVSGTSISSAGDVNGDGFDDVIVGAWRATVDGNAQAGETYVVFGSGEGFPGAIELSSLDGTNGFMLTGGEAFDNSGASVASAGDINGDGYDDLIIGASGVSPDGVDRAGAAYVVFGSGSPFDASIDLSSLSGSDGFAIHGINAGEHAGSTVSGAGDINGDGFDDLLVTAPRADPEGRPDAGEVYIIFGTDRAFDASLNLADLDGSNGLVVYGRTYLGAAGAISGGGDINGDGYDDLVLGSGAAGSGGQSYVVFGGPNLHDRSTDADWALSVYGGGDVSNYSVTPLSSGYALVTWSVVYYRNSWSTNYGVLVNPNGQLVGDVISFGNGNIGYSVVPEANGGFLFASGTGNISRYDQYGALQQDGVVANLSGAAPRSLVAQLANGSGVEISENADGTSISVFSVVLEGVDVTPFVEHYVPYEFPHPESYGSFDSINITHADTQLDTDVFRADGTPRLSLADAHSAHAFTMNGTTYLAVTGSGDEPGLTIFSVSSDGSLTFVTSRRATEEWLRLNEPGDITSVQIGGRTFLIVADPDERGLMSLEFHADGTLSFASTFSDRNQPTSIAGGGTGVEVAEIDGQTYLISMRPYTNAITTYSIDENGQLARTEYLTTHGSNRGVTDDNIAVATIDGRVFVYATVQSQGRVYRYELENDGSLTPLGFIGDTASTALSGAVALEVVTIGDDHYLYVGGYSADGVSVFSIDASGGLRHVHTVYDNASLALDGVSSVTSAEIDGTNYLFVTGLRDDGISIFSIGSNGRLTAEETIYDSDGIALEGAVDAVVFSVVGAATPFLATISRYEGGVSIFNLGEDAALAGAQLTRSVVGTDGDDSLIGIAGDDNTAGGDGNDTLSGAGGADTLTGGAGNDRLNGGSGNDTLLGGADRDNLNGSNGNDSVSGGDGNDTLWGGAGADTISGGAGGDWSGYSGSPTGVSVNLTTGRSSGGYAEGDVISGIEHLWGSSHGDNFIGNSAANSLQGNLGNDTLSGAGGNDTLGGGAGNDRLNGGSGNDTLSGGADRDNLNGSNGNDSVSGGDGNDTLWGGAGADTISGGAGGDWSGYSGSPTGVSVNLTTGRSSGGYAEGDVISGIEHLWGSSHGDNFIGNSAANSLQGNLGNDTLSGAGGDDTLGGGAGNDRLNGGSGNDTLLGGADRDNLNGSNGNDSISGGDGNDTLWGGAGADTISGGAGGDWSGYSGSPTGVSVNLTTGRSSGGYAEGDVISGIEYLWGSSHGDNFIGSSAANNLQGNLGNDTLAGAAGDDTLGGGAGNDRLNGGSGNDTLLGGADRDNLNGSNGNDSISGGDGNDTLWGGAGADTISGGAGGDWSGYSGSPTGVSVNLTTGRSSGGYAEGDVISGIEYLWGSSHGDNFIGSSAANNLQGNLGNDTLAGAAGDDTLGGGAGNDRLNGGSGNDTLLGGADRDNLNGSNGNDSVSGGDGNDTLWGGAGADTISGGAGGDWSGYSGSPTGVSVNLTTGRSSGGYAEGDVISGIEYLWGSSHGDNFIGSSAANNLQGNLGNDTLSGAAGDDTLGGGAGNDRLNGGSGNDTLLGGDGADTFVFDSDWDGDVVRDFADEEDLLDFSSTGLTYDDLTITQDGANTVISDSNGNSVTLLGVQANTISESDFLF